MKLKFCYTWAVLNITFKTFAAYIYSYKGYLEMCNVFPKAKMSAYVRCFSFFMSPLTSHLSPVTCHLSPVTCHLTPIISRFSCQETKAEEYLSKNVRAKGTEITLTLQILERIRLGADLLKRKFEMDQIFIFYHRGCSQIMSAAEGRGLENADIG